MTANQQPESTHPYDQQLAIYVARLICRVPISPNQISLFGMALGLIAAWLFSTGDRAAANWAAAIFVVAVWIDHLDGEFARLTDQSTPFGHYVDTVCSLITYLTMFVGAGLGFRYGTYGNWTVAAGIVTGIAIVMIFGIRQWLYERFGGESVAQSQKAGFEIEDFLYVVAPVTWLGQLELLVLIAGVCTPAFLLWVIWSATRIIRASDIRRKAG